MYNYFVDLSRAVIIMMIITSRYIDKIDWWDIVQTNKPGLMTR